MTRTSSAGIDVSPQSVARPDLAKTAACQLKKQNDATITWTKSLSGIVCESCFNMLQHFHTWIGTTVFSNCLCEGKKPKPEICGKVPAAARKMQNAKGHTKAFTAEALTALKHILQCFTNKPLQHTRSHKIMCKNIRSAVF